MADFTGAIGALRNVLVGFVPASGARLPVFFQNSDVAPTISIAPDGFVYSEARLQDEQQKSLRTHLGVIRRDYGELTIYVFVPRGALIGFAEGYAQELRAAFPQTVGDVFVTRKVIDAGQMVDGPQGREFAVSVRVEWFSDRLE